MVKQITPNTTRAIFRSFSRVMSSIMTSCPWSRTTWARWLVCQLFSEERHQDKCPFVHLTCLFVRIPLPPDFRLHPAADICSNRAADIIALARALLPAGGSAFGALTPRRSLREAGFFRRSESGPE